MFAPPLSIAALPPDLHKLMQVVSVMLWNKRTILPLGNFQLRSPLPTFQTSQISEDLIFTNYSFPENLSKAILARLIKFPRLWSRPFYLCGPAFCWRGGGADPKCKTLIVYLVQRIIYELYEFFCFYVKQLTTYLNYEY